MRGHVGARAPPGVLLAAVLLCASWECALACCPGNCNGHGECSDDKQCVCQCHLGFTGGDCSLYVCPSGRAWNDMATGPDTAHALAECSNVGHCDRTTGTCQCAAGGFLSGFAGPACERRVCPGNPECSGHGTCMSMRDYANTAETGYQTDPFAAPPVYETPWDADKMWGCKCDPGYMGEDCLRRACPTGDDPLTRATVGVGPQVDEVHNFTCNATQGSFYLQFRRQSTAEVAATASAAQLQAAINALDTVSGAEVRLTGAEGALHPAQSTVCGAPVRVTQEIGGVNVTWINMSHGFEVTFKQEFGDLPLTLAYGGNLLKADGTAAQLVAHEKVRGNKEDDLCSNRGLCDVTTGVCTCNVGFDTSDGRGGKGNLLSNRGDCGNALGSVTACPGEVKCSAHGICQQDTQEILGVQYEPSFRCACSRGWMGTDCSERSCPLGPAWFGYPSADNVAHGPTECSSMGLCDRTKGECACVPGFTGGACERMGCGMNCFGHGQCLTMQLLAEKQYAMRGGPQPSSYGSANSHLAWDFNSIQGCYCDDNWHGYDCMLKACPSGDDPLTRGQNDEVQLLRCNYTAAGAAAPAGAFTLTFRGLTTADIPHTATEAEVKAALEALGTLRAVDVQFTRKNDAVGDAAKLAADVACTTDASNWIRVRFLSELGDLPALVFAGSGGIYPTAELQQDGQGLSVLGTKENVFCSNRGLCNFETGLCTCFHGFGSSDGNGGKGTRGDCGHYLEYGGPISAF